MDAGRRAPFLLTLCEEDENELHITICCAKAEPNAQTPSTGNAALDDILAHCTPLCPDENAKIELIFENYLLYQVRNESYCVFDADEVPQRHLSLHVRTVQTARLSSPCH